MRLDLGKPVHCSDGEFGELADVVIDPTKKRVTHLVVKPHDPDDVTRLVPIELVTSVDETEPGIVLRCTVDEVRKLDHVQEYAYLRLGEFPVADPEWDVGIQGVLAMPYYESSLGDVAELDVSGVMYDRIPKGEVEIRRGSDVNASDGHHLGEVDGFLVDDEAMITHFVLERGHLWGKREVTIPIGAVAKVETDAVTLSLSKDEVEKLPSARVQRWF